MKGIPSSMEKKAAEELYKNIRKAMNIKRRLESLGDCS